MKQLIFLILFLVFIMLAVSVAASSIDIAIDHKELKTRLNTSVKLLLTIKNNQNLTDKFVIQVRGAKAAWVSFSAFSLAIESNHSDMVDLIFYPTGGEIGAYAYDIIVGSLTNPRINQSKKFLLQVGPPVEIKGLSISKTGYVLNVNLDVESSGWNTLGILFQVRDKGNNLLTDLKTEVNVKGNETISKIINLPDRLSPGDYQVLAEIENFELSVKEPFKMEAIRDVSYVVEKVSAPLAEDVTVYITNNGNVVEENFQLTQRMADVLTGFAVKPNNCIQESGSKVCDFIIDRLEPRETKVIKYRLDFWPTYTGYGAVIFLIISVVVYSFITTTRPSIKKRYIRKGKYDFSIVLEIKNPFLHHVKDVIIRDFMGPLAQVTGGFEPFMPVTKKSDAGTELIWKIGDMRPNETRMLSYKINALIDGNLKLPKAYIRFRNKEGKNIRIHSKRIVLN